MAISPISGGLPPIGPLPSSASSAQAKAPAGGFGEALQSYLGQVNQDQQASNAAVEDLVTGQTQDVLPAVAAVAKADISFKLLMGVRNKMIEAYKQTINMQI
jgi:flagellar hook-basal body complex protein FliE